MNSQEQYIERKLLHIELSGFLSKFPEASRIGGYSHKCFFDVTEDYGEYRQESFNDKIWQKY
jgi:hypothetical protein